MTHEASCSIYVLVHRRDIKAILTGGLRAPDFGGPELLGAPDLLARRAAIELPAPFRNPLSSYVSMRFTPRTPSTLSVLTGYRGTELVSPADLVILVSQPDWIAKLRHGFLFTNLGLASGRAEFYADLSRLNVIDGERLAQGKFDARKDPESPHIAEAEFLIWERLSPRGIVEIICHAEKSVAEIEKEVVAVGRQGRIRVSVDPIAFFGYS